MSTAVYQVLDLVASYIGSLGAVAVGFFLWKIEAHRLKSDETEKVRQRFRILLEGAGPKMRTFQQDEFVERCEIFNRHNPGYNWVLLEEIQRFCERAKSEYLPGAILFLWDLAKQYPNSGWPAGEEWVKSNSAPIKHEPFSRSE